MSETIAAIGFGNLLKRRISTGPDVYQTIGQQVAVKAYSIAVDSIDASHEESDGMFREFIPGLGDAGEAGCDLHYLPGGATETDILGIIGTVQDLRFVTPSGAYIQYRAFLTGKEPDTPLDDKMVTSLTWKLTGKPIPHAAQAPVNAVLPSISGVPQEGQVLTANNGVWDKEPTSFSYQWKNAGVAIPGATAKTYTPVTGDVGDTLTVTVTGVNSAGSASATSAGAIAVIAA